jgi:hypothetical protein
MIAPFVAFVRRVPENGAPATAQVGRERSKRKRMRTSMTANHSMFAVVFSFFRLENATT